MQINGTHALTALSTTTYRGMCFTALYTLLQSALITVAGIALGAAVGYGATALWKRKAEELWTSTI